ncbi:MAG: hypothetical protein NZM30_01485 [Geminocystis sp.]|nr:hypothetical protein [Geminocystis sp.]
MSITNLCYLYQLAWEYHPNALLAVNSQFIIQLVNPAFCSLFKLPSCHIRGEEAVNILGDIAPLKNAWEKQTVIENEIREYPKAEIFVREFIYPIPEQDLILCILIDLTEEVRRKKEIAKMQEEVIKQVNQVVHNQMKVAQEIAGLLGETTAETKVNLFKLLQLFEHKENSIEVDN